MDISITELFHLLFPGETTEHDDAYSYAVRHIHGFSTFDAAVVSDSLAKRIVEVQTVANVELMIVQRIDKYNFVFTRRSWHESPYRVLLLRQRSDALRAAALAAAESQAAADSWRIEVHAYMAKLAIAIADRAGISRVAFLKTALQDMAARQKYDLDSIRTELGALFGYDDAELDALFVAPPVKDKRNEQQSQDRSSTEEDPSQARQDPQAAAEVQQAAREGGQDCGAARVGDHEAECSRSESRPTDTGYDTSGIDAAPLDSSGPQG